MILSSEKEGRMKKHLTILIFVLFLLIPNCKEIFELWLFLPLPKETTETNESITHNNNEEITIASWNLKNFGQTKC